MGRVQKGFLMIVFDENSNFVFSAKDKRVLTIGTFDGIHLGHRRILYMMRRIARKSGAKVCVITFYPHPRKLLYENSNVSTITSFTEKIKLLAKLRVDQVMLLHFTPELAALTADEFFARFIVGENQPMHVVMGYDHAFGKGRKGDFAFMEQKALRYGFGLSHVGPREIGGKPVSSSRIRYLLSQGNLDWSHRLLGRRYSMRGVVVAGAGRGKSLGFATANLRPDLDDKLIPRDGVYEAVVYLPKQKAMYSSVVNIGNNPTFNGMDRSIEAHILDFDQDIYDETIELIFLRFVRHEIRFSSIEKLRDQIQKDIALVNKSHISRIHPISDSILSMVDVQVANFRTHEYFAGF